MRSSARSKKRCVSRAGPVARLRQRRRCIVSTLLGSNPASTWRSAVRLRSITPAPISSTSDSATSQTISTRRVRTPTAPSLRPPSFSASFRSVRPAREAPASRRRERRSRIDAPATKSSTRAVDGRSRRRAAPGRPARGAAASSLARASSRPGDAAGAPRAPAPRQQLLEHAAAPGAERRRGSRAPCVVRARARTAGCRRSRRRSAARARPPPAA